MFLLVGVAVLGQTAQPDPAFDGIPFDNWLKGGHGAKIDWSLSVDPPALTEFQRLLTSVAAAVDAGTAAKWQYSGPMVLLIEVRDRQNRRYRTHLPLVVPKDANDSAGWKWSLSLCVVPGDYEIAAAIYDTESKEHNLRRIKLHVPGIHNDPLPGLWSGAPVAESGELAWRDPLRLPLKTGNPLQIDLMINTPVDAETGIGARFMVASQIAIPDGSITATDLDLENRTVKTQKVVGRLGPNAFLGALPKDNRQMVNAHSLDVDMAGAQFFVSEISKRVEQAIPGTEHVVIILSDRKSSPNGENFEPIQATPALGTRVFYVRCSLPPTAWMTDSRRGGTVINVPVINRNSDVPAVIEMPPPPPPWYRADSLERTLDPLHPHLFDVATPIEFRHALAEIMKEISEPK